MPRKQLTPRDKVVMRMTREGAVEENLTEGTSEKVTKRLEDAQLVKPHEKEDTTVPDKVKKHCQPRPDELFSKAGRHSFRGRY